MSAAATMVVSLLYFFWRQIFEPSVVIKTPLASASSTSHQWAIDRLTKSPSQQKILKKISLAKMAKDDEDDVEVLSFKAGGDVCGGADNEKLTQKVSTT